VTVKSALGSVFSLDTFDHRRSVLTTGISVAEIVLGTQLGLFNKILHPVGLNPHEWLICNAAALTIWSRPKFASCCSDAGKRRPRGERAAVAAGG
jgi:hypothetical protein